MDYRKKLAENIRDHRIKQGFSQEFLGELSGLHRTYIGSVERSEVNISIDNIEKICKALNVHITDLLDD